MENINLPTVITLGGYVVIIFMIAIIASRKVKTLSDYLLAGRNLSGPIAAMGVGASDMSAWLLLALPGTVWLNGINQAWIPIGLCTGALLNWIFVAKRLRIYTEVANDSLTIPAYFNNRFRDNTRLLRAITAIVILIFFTVYAASGFKAGALLTQLAFNWDYPTALAVSATVIIAYTCIGGFLAINWIDFFQGSLMFIAILSVPLVTIFNIGGWDQMITRIDASNPNLLSITHNMDALAIASLFFWGLGYFGQPHILSRFMAAKDAAVIPMARKICMSWMALSLLGAVLVGMSGIAFYAGEVLQEPETVFLNLARDLFNPWLVGGLLAAVLSASMSTIAAQLIVSASSLTEDFYHPFFRKKATSKELIIISRITVVLTSLVAIWFAASEDAKLLTLVQYAWSGTGAAFGPVILFSLYSKRITNVSAIAGMIVGAATVIIWYNLRAHHGGIFRLGEIVPGFFISCAVIYLINRFYPQKDASVLQEFDKMQQLAHPTAKATP